MCNFWRIVMRKNTDTTQILQALQNYACLIPECLLSLGFLFVLFVFVCLVGFFVLVGFLRNKIEIICWWAQQAHPGQIPDLCLWQPPAKQFTQEKRLTVSRRAVRFLFCLPFINPTFAFIQENQPVDWSLWVTQSPQVTHTGWYDHHPRNGEKFRSANF